ncbi:MAG: hypothetical protein ACI8PZ_006898 [Myxococcota bacterium]
MARHRRTCVPLLEPSPVDWHIGVVSTDMDNPNQSGHLRSVDGHTFLDRDTPNPAATFESMAVLGWGGSGVERGREAAFTALELNQDGANAGFLRDDSELHVVFVSDEDDRSTNDPITADGFVRFLREQGAVAHAAVFPDGVVDPFGDAEAGFTYVSYAQQTDGVRVDIRSDLGGLVVGIADAFPRQLFAPTLAPDLATLDVMVELEDGTLIDIDDSTWAWDDDVGAVEFVDYLPAVGDSIVLSYSPLL